jgi:hypothetical protein
VKFPSSERSSSREARGPAAGENKKTGFVIFEFALLIGFYAPACDDGNAQHPLLFLSRFSHFDISVHFNMISHVQ